MAEYEKLTAPILAGTQCNWALLGTLTLQVYKFHTCFPHETVGIKALVYTIFLLEIAQTALTSHFAYATLVMGWGDPTVFVHLPWSSVSTPIFTGITSATVQIFFAWRIYTLGGHQIVYRLAAAAIVLLALMQSLAAIISDARFAVTTQFAEITKLMFGVKVWLFGSAVVDVLITVTMIFILSEYRRRIPWRRTDGLITKLIYNTIENGAITSVVAITDVVLFITLPGTNLHQWPAFMLGKLYSNVLLVSLNARDAQRKSAATNTSGNIDSGYVSELQWRRRTGTEAEGAEGSGKVHVDISTTMDVARNLDNKPYPRNS